MLERRKDSLQLLTLSTRATLKEEISCLKKKTLLKLKLVEVKEIGVKQRLCLGEFGERGVVG